MMDRAISLTFPEYRKESFQKRGDFAKKYLTVKAYTKN